MPYQIGDNYHGFRLLEDRKIDEINSQGKVFLHEKSGAKLLYLGNKDDNKVFSISFRTPPADSTGVPHIIEHSVLCGSRKFPLKEPFVELVKGSLNTFLNAMTFPDKTMYPVASRNDKDFRNLMDVYLDAVFYPNIYQSPETLMQEGWHYELETPESELTYKGVVYNEMKGAFSSPDSILEQKILKTLFPDTAYGHESGGDPEFIPQLTQEKFLDFHRTYYHPANSYIFLYGDMDLLDYLKFLDEAYLGSFTRIPVETAIPLQTTFLKTVNKVFDYPVSMAEKTIDKTFFSLNFVVSKATNPETTLAFQILEHMLLESPAAPLRKALTEAGIGKDVFGNFQEGMIQPVLTIGVSGSNPEQEEAFVKVVYRTLQELSTNGIDKKLIEASLNLLEFRLREANYGTNPKGLIYNINCMESWLYDENPFLHLEYEPILAKVKTALTTRYFEEIIEQCLMDNTHRALVVLRPRQGMTEEFDNQVRETLATHKASLSPNEIDALIRQSQELKQRQEAPDTPENLAKIPLLDRSDIKKEAEKIILDVRKESETTILFSPLFTNKIAYLTFYFDAGVIPREQVPYMYLLADVLGKISTEKYAYGDLANEINIHSGGIGYDAVAYSEGETDTVYHPKFIVSVKALVDKLPAVMELLKQILTASAFDDVKRLQEIVAETKEGWSQSLFRLGRNIAAGRALAYFSPVGRYNEQSLLSFYQFIVDLEKNFEGRKQEVTQNLASVAEKLFAKPNLLVSLTAEEEHYSDFQTSFALLNSCLKKEAPPKQDYQLEFLPQNEGLMTSGQVQYVVKAANFRRHGYSYHGSMRVLETMLRYDYLWTKIRVQGGAYGGFANFYRNGNMILGSYRDPNLSESLQVFDQTADYLRSFKSNDREMTKYIIGTMSKMDTPLTPPMKGERAASSYIRKISQQNVQKERDEILATGIEDIRALADLVETAMKDNYLCVLGNEDKIRQSEAIFRQIVHVFE